jgi:hypothetical protein
VLSSLPSTRPQRPSARRAAARQSAAARAGRASAQAPERGEAKPKRKASPTRTAQSQAERAAAQPKRAPQTTPRPTAKPRVAPKPAEPPVPRQGFESEETIEMGRPVQPPSGSELATSMVELVGELAQTGLSAGGRALRDALTRLVGG